MEEPMTEPVAGIKLAASPRDAVGCLTPPCLGADHHAGMACEAGLATIGDATATRRPEA
jgi:hypothetical protein